MVISIIITVSPSLTKAGETVSIWSDLDWHPDEWRPSTPMDECGRPHFGCGGDGCIYGPYDEDFGPCPMREPKKKRKGKTSKAQRFKILQRDNFKCVYCGRGADDGVVLEVDHTIPTAKGGSNRMSNKQTTCYDCNHGKHTRIVNR